jgi:hypothetical protein
MNVTVTAGISQYKPIQSAKYCNLIGWLRATELDYIVKCPQCVMIGRVLKTRCGGVVLTCQLPAFRTMHFSVGL